MQIGRALRREFDSHPRHLFIHSCIIEPLYYNLSISSIMRRDKENALKLRLQGRSYNEIGRLLGVPKSTLSGWFTGLQLSDKAQKRIQDRVYRGTLRGLIKRNKNQTHLAIQRMRNIRAVAEKEIKKIGLSDLKLIGIALYWAEGYKRAAVRNGRELTCHAVALANSDPKLILLFIRFLKEVCHVPDEEINAEIRIYEHLNESELLNFWQRTTKIPRANFGKVYYGISRSSIGKRPFNRLPYGTISVRVNSTNLFHKIMGWIQGLSNHAAIV